MNLGSSCPDTGICLSADNREWNPNSVSLQKQKAPLGLLNGFCHPRGNKTPVRELLSHCCFCSTLQPMNCTARYQSQD